MADFIATYLLLVKWAEENKIKEEDLALACKIFLLGQVNLDTDMQEVEPSKGETLKNLDGIYLTSELIPTRIRIKGDNVEVIKTTSDKEIFLKAFKSH